MILNIPKLEGDGTYALQWAISLLNIQGSGEGRFSMGERL